MKIIVLGPQGSGKGTHSSKLSNVLNVPHISSGDILRDNVSKQTELGIKAKEYMDKGDLVPDEIVIQLMKKRFEESDCNDGFILDGFPRTLEQAKELDKIAEIDIVLYLEIPEWLAIERLGNRVVCKNCKEIYNLKSVRPKQDGICDECGGELYQREDETPEAIKQRLNEYKEKTEPLIEYYKNKGILKTFFCDKDNVPVEENFQKILSIVRS